MADRVDAARPALDAVSILLLVRVSLAAVSVAAVIWLGYRFYGMASRKIASSEIP